MTSTNDGKDVKSNNTSGHRSKSQYIELYKSLDASLNSDCELGTLTGYLCGAWRRVHSLCSHSAPATHPHLVAWIQRHTARTVLQTQWQSPTSRDYQTTLDQTLKDFIQETGDVIIARNRQCLQWESQLLERAVWFRSVLPSPWEHPVLKALLDPNTDQPTDDEVLEWLKEERGIIFVTRLRQLALSKGCDDLSLTLTTAIMNRIRAGVVVCPDMDQLDHMREKPPSPESPPTFEQSLRSEAGFTQDVLDLLTDIELVLLHKRNRDQCISLAKATPLRTGHALVERLAGRLDQSPSEKKLWKSARHVASVVAQVIIARCMVIPWCVGVARTALYWCARTTARLVEGDRLPSVVRALAAPAVSARHLYTFASANHKQLAEMEDRRGLVCELFIRAITSGMYELEKLDLETTGAKEKEARHTLQQTLASWFIQLGNLLSSSERVKCECMLTAFSVHPSMDMYERIKQAPVLPPLTVESSETKKEVQPSVSNTDFTSWAMDSQQQSNLVKTSRIYNIEPKENLANVLTTGLFSEGEKLGLNPELCQDLAVLLSRPRVKTFSWDLDREVLLEYCRSYMERTSGGTKCLSTELRFLNLDPKTYEHLPTEEDDEDDLYYGIQKGYEHLLEFEPEPEVIWQDALISQPEESAESDADDKTYTTTSRRKKKTRHSSESDSDPLSVVTKVKHDKKTDQPHSKELSKEPKQRGKKDTTKQKDKKEQKEKKQIHKKEKQPTNYHSDSKPVKSELSKFLGFKVVNMSFEDEFRNSLQRRPQIDPLANLTDPLRFNSHPGKKAQNKSTRLGTPVTDSDYDSQGKSSHKSETPEPEAVSNKNFPVDDIIKSPKEMNKKPSPAVKEGISRLLNYRKQKAEELKNSASRDNSLAALVGSKIYNKQPIMIPDLPNLPKPVLGNKSKSNASSKSVATNTSTNTKSLLIKPSKNSSSAPGQKTRKPRKPSTKKIKSEPSLNTNSQTNSSLLSPTITLTQKPVSTTAPFAKAPPPTITPTQKPVSNTTAPFAKASFDPNQKSYHSFLMELEETKRIALLRSQDPKPATKSTNKSTSKIISTSVATQSAKPTQQKMETPNTFARRNHQHQTNKRIIQHQESLEIFREIDQRVANMSQKNDSSISQYNPSEVLNPHFNAANSSRIEPRVEIQKVEEPTPASSLIAANHPVTLNALNGNVVTVARNPAYISPKPNSTKIKPGHSALYEKDVLRLLMQQNKLNAKVESLAVGKTSILEIQKIKPAKNDSMTNQMQEQSLIYGLSIKQETLGSPVIPHSTVMQTANMVQSLKPAAKRKTIVKNCPKKDVQSPSLLSANTSPIFQASANTIPVLLKTYGSSNQFATDTAYNFAKQASSATYKSQVTEPVPVNTKQTLTRQVLLASAQASRNSPTISTSAGHISIEPIKTTGDMAETAGVTSNLNEKVQMPYASPSQRKEWERVFDGLLKLKTPCRGPTALEMTLNKDNKEAKTESLRQLRIVKSNSKRSVSLERPLETKSEIKSGQSSQDLHIPSTNMNKLGIKKLEAFKKEVSDANKAVDDMIKKLDRKAKRRSRAKVKVQNQPLMEELVVRKPTVQYPKKDPIPLGFTRSDYDIMLGDLLDDDLLQEIEESPVQCSRQNDSKNSYKNDIIFSKPEERVTIPAYGTKVEEAHIPATQNLPNSNTSINEKNQQHSKHTNLVIDLPPNPLPKEKPQILSNVPISLGSLGIKNVLDKNARIIPPQHTSPKIQHANEILLRKPNANTNLPGQNQAQLEIVNSVPQNVFLAGSKNNYETHTIYGQSVKETIPPLISANTNNAAKTSDQKTPETVNAASINKQAIINQVVIKAPYPAVTQNDKNGTIITTETVNTASPSNKHAVDNQAVIPTPCPTVSKIIKKSPETVNTELTSVNTHKVNTSVVFNAPYPTVGQTVKTIPVTPETVNSASTPVNKHAVSTSVVFNAPYPTVGQTINIPTTSNIKITPSNQNVHKSAYPVVGQTIKMHTCNKSVNVYLMPVQPDKAQITAKTTSVIEAAPKLLQHVINTTKPALDIEATPTVKQNVIKNTKQSTQKLKQKNITNITKVKPTNVTEATPKLQQGVIEITPKLEENVKNTTKLMPVIEPKSKKDIAKKNDDNARIYLDKKVLSEVPEKPNNPSKIYMKNKATSLDIEIKKDNQERLVKKRLSLINRQVDHRCYYPPIPLSYVPIIIKPNVQKKISTTEKDVEKSKAVNKLREDIKVINPSAIKEPSEDLVPIRVSKRIKIRNSTRLLTKKIIEEEKALINKFTNEYLSSAAACDETTLDKSKLHSNVQLTDIPKHSDLTGKNITEHSENNLEQSESEIVRSTNEKLNKLVSEMATTIDIITKSTVEPVVSEEEEPIVIQTASETILKDPLETLVHREQLISRTIQKDQVTKTKVIANKPYEVTYAEALPKETDNRQIYLKEANLLNHVKDPSIENAKLLENDVIVAKKCESKDVKDKEQDCKEQNLPLKVLNTEVIDLGSDSDTENEKLEPEKTYNGHVNDQKREDNTATKSEIPQSWKDSVRITEMPSDCKNPYQRKVRIALPNNKNFTATITGKHHISFDDLFAIPQVKSILQNANAPVRHTIRVTNPDISTNNYDQGTLETVDLLSDDDDSSKQQLTKEKVRLQYFVTEFGKFRASNHIDELMLSQHQQKFSQKCILKLQRCKQPEIVQVQEVQENVIDPLTLPLKDNHEKSQENKDPEPYVISEVIDLDESSNDSVVAVEDVTVPNVAPVKKINKFKNLLLKELFLDNMLNLNPDDILNPTSEPKSDDSGSVVTILSSDVDVPIQKEDFSKMIDKKCGIKLTRCDDIVRNYKVKVTENRFDDKLEDVATVTNNLELEPAPSSPALSRSGSFSILNELDYDTVVSSPEIDVFQALSEIHEIDKAQREKVTSPVMQEYDIIASVFNKTESKTEKTVQTVCNTEWFFTKPKLNRLAIRFHLDENSENEIIMNSKLDTSTDYEDSFNSSDTEKAQITLITCDADFFMTKLQLHFHDKNFNKCEIATTAITKLDNSTNCEDITDCSKPKIDTETHVKFLPNLKTIMANYFADNPIVKNMQHIAARLDQNINATMSPLKRKSTNALTNKSSKVSRMARSQSEIKIDISVKSSAPIVKPDNAFVQDFKELIKAEESNKLKITHTFNADQNDNDYLLSQKYSAGHNMHEITKRIDMVKKMSCASKNFVSFSIVKQDVCQKLERISEIPDSTCEPCVPETCMDISDTLSVEASVKLFKPILEDTKSLEVFHNKPSSLEPIKKIPGQKDGPCGPETIIISSNIPSAELLEKECVFELTVEDNKQLHEVQDKLSTSEPISEIHDQKEIITAIADSPSVDSCASEGQIIEISDSLVTQDKPSKLILIIPDSTYKPRVPETTIKVHDLPRTEPCVKASVSELVLEETILRHELQDKSSTVPIAKPHDIKDEPCISESIMELAVSLSVDPCATEEPIIEISDSVVEQDKPFKLISEITDSTYKLCVPETTMIVADHPSTETSVKSSISEPVFEDTKSLHELQDKTFSPEPIAEIHDKKDEPCISQTIMEIVDPLILEPCVSEKTIIEISDSAINQNKPHELILKIPDSTNEPCLRGTIMKVIDPPITEPYVKASVSKTVLEKNESLNKLHENPSASDLIAQIPDPTNEPGVPVITMVIADPSRVKPSASEPIIVISESLANQDKPSSTELIEKIAAPISVGLSVKVCVSGTLDESQEKPSSKSIAQFPDPETTMGNTDPPNVKTCASKTIAEISDLSEQFVEVSDLIAEPCVPEINMDNFELLVKVCLSELMSKEAKSLNDLPKSNIESTMKDTELQEEMPVSQTTVADITSQEKKSPPEPMIKDTVVEYREPIHKVSVSENVLQNTKQEESNEAIDWIGQECIIKNESDSANSSFESIPVLDLDDGKLDDDKMDASETKTKGIVDERDLVLITDWGLNPALLEHAYEKIPCSYTPGEISVGTNKIKTKSDREVICTDTDEIEKDIHEPVVDISEIFQCENISENRSFNGDDTVVVLKRENSEQECPFLGFESLNTYSDCIIKVIKETETDEDQGLECKKLYEKDQELTLVIPKVTYSMKRRKRKLVDFTLLGNAKRALRQKSTDTNVSFGRKRKSIDARKLSVSAINKQSYSNEFGHFIAYCDSIDLSYSFSYGVEQIDATELLQNWPIKDEYTIYDGEIKVVDLFTDDSDIKPHEFEIGKLSFAEEINAAIEQKIEAFDSAHDTNFNMGFGERSDRVIQDLKQVGATSKLSAATLSDVKQYQPFLLSENINNTNFNSNEQILLHATEDYEIVHRFMRGVNLHRKIRQFFKSSTSELNKQYENIKSKDYKMSKIGLPFKPGDFKQSPVEITVGVVQVGQLPVSAAAQNPVTCDPRVTHVSDASPSQYSENSPSDDPEQSNKTEYTELTTADLSMPIIGQEYSHSDVPLESQDSYTPCENITIESSLIQSDIRIELEEESPEEPIIKIKTEPVQSENDEFSTEADPDRNISHQSDSNAQFVTPQQECQEPVVSHQSINGSKDKNDQIAQAMNVAGITNDEEATATASRTRALVDLLTSISQGQTTSSQNTTMTFPKTTTINAMSLQQALAQILPPPLNQTVENQQVPMSVPQVLHIVHNNSGGKVTLVDGGQQSVINSNSTPMIHIVQNKVSNGCPPGNGVPAQQQNSFSGLSLVDAGLQQGGGQLLHIVNTGNQKNPNTGQLLKRVNLLTNLTNVQGSNEQKMLQFVCKSADGKSIQLSSPHQRSMVLRLQPIETLDVQNAQKHTESQDHNSIPTSNASSKDSASQQEIKSRSVYEENYAKFIQNSSVIPGSEKSTSLPKFNQAFGKPVFQDGNEKSSDSASDVHLSSGNSNENTDVQTSESTINIDNITGINNPPLLLRKSTAQVSQAQPTLVQQLKQTIAPMNIQTMHGGVIYTRQIPVNIGGGQTINLISVPTTELADESGQKQPEVQFVKQGDIDGTPSIIKIVPQIPAPNAEVSEDGSVNLQNDGQNPQPQPVLTQMRIKLPMLSKNPQMIAGARVVRPSFFQIQRSVIGGVNQPVYQQLVLTAAPQLGQQTIRLPQAQQVKQVKVPDNQSPSESQMSSSTLEQLREFDMVLEQVKERSIVQPNSSASGTIQGIKASTDTTDSPVSTSSKPTETKQVLYTIGGSHSVAYVNRKATVTTLNTPSFSRSPDSSGTIDSPASSSQIRQATSETPQTVQNDKNPTPPKSKSHKSKSKSKSTSYSSHSSSKVSSAVPHKPSTQKPLEDEQTTQRILYILAEYKEQVENSPDKDKPAPRRRTNPPSNPGSRRKKRRSGARDVSPAGDDSRTLGSEDSSCGTSQGDCAESCVDSVSPQSSPRKVSRKLTFDPDATPNATSTTPIRPQPPRNVIVADGQTLAVARGASGKPATAVIMPANYLLPVSMMKGGQQIAIVTNQGPKLLTVTGGESPAANALLLQRLIGPAVKPVLARPGIRHVRLPTAALQRIQTFNLASTANAANNVTAADSTASQVPETTPEADPQTSSPPWADKESESKPDRASSPEGSEPWHLPSSADPNDYSYEETVRTDNLDRTVLEAIPDRYSPDMEAHRIFDKMFDVESKKSYVDSPHRYDIDAVDEDKTYQVVHKKDLSAARQHRLAYISAAALRHKHAILEHELRLQKSLSEECEDLGVDSPSASDLFPEAELLFSGSPAADHGHERDHEPPHHPPQPTILNETLHAHIDDQMATDELLPREDLAVGLEDVGIVTVSDDGLQATITLDQEEFARAHPNTTFHSEPTDGEVQQFTLPSIKGRHITSAIFHPSRPAATVLMTAPQTTVISQPDGEPVKYTHIDNVVHTPRYVQQNVNLNSVLVKDDGSTRFDGILTDTRELHLSNTASAIVHGNTTQVIRRVCYEDDKRDRFMIDEPESVIAGRDAKMIAEHSRDATLNSVADASSPERNTELFWESNSASERSESRRPLDFSSDSDKCCKSPLYDETNSTDSSGVGTHTRLDSVIKEARGVERSRSADGSSADDTHPPLRTYPPKRSYHNDSIDRPRYNDVDRSVSGKTRAGYQPEPSHDSPDLSEVRRRASNRGVVKRGCHCCNGSPAPSRPKKSRQKKSHTDISSNH